MCNELTPLNAKENVDQLEIVKDQFEKKQSDPNLLTNCSSFKVSYANGTSSFKNVCPKYI